MKKVLLLVVFVLTLSIGMNPVTTSAAIADGTYTLNYQVNQHETNSASIANDYFLKPAKLIVTNGNMKIQITIKKSSWVKRFDPPGGATVVNSKGTDQRVVQFNISNFNSITVGMKVDINDLQYHHEYNTNFIFFEDSLKLVQAAQKPAEITNPKTSEPNNKNQVSNNQQTNNSQNSKPISSKEKSQDNSSTTNTQSNVSSSSSDTRNDSVSNNASYEDSLEESEQIEVQEPNPDTADTFPYIYVLVFIGSIMLLVSNKYILKN